MALPNWLRMAPLWVSRTAVRGVRVEWILSASGCCFAVPEGLPQGRRVVPPRLPDVFACIEGALLSSASLPVSDGRRDAIVSAAAALGCADAVDTELKVAAWRLCRDGLAVAVHSEQSGGGRMLVSVQGAPETVLPLCSEMVSDDSDSGEPLRTDRIWRWAGRLRASGLDVATVALAETSNVESANDLIDSVLRKPMLRCAGLIGFGQH